MLTIKVLGPGCRNCEKLEALTRQALGKLGAEATVEKVTDYAAIMGYNVISTPGLVVNERVVSAGRIPSEAEITTWLTDALTTA
jgi:small redox-active disulfide protein 2